MAIWIYAYGKNEILEQNQNVLELLNEIDLDEIKILDSILEITGDRESIAKYYRENRISIEEGFYADSDEDYYSYLDSINYPKMERSKLVDYFISEGVEREERERKLFERTYEQFKNGTLKSKWEEIAQNCYLNRLGDLYINDGLKVVLTNDLIHITGPFDIFSGYYRFQDSISKSSREYYHTLFKQICASFGSDFILYTIEGAGLDDDEDDDFDFEKLKEQADWTNSSSRSLHSMNGFYFEKLSELNLKK